MQAPGAFLPGLRQPRSCMRPTLRLENPIDTPRTLSARRSSASFPGAGGFGWLLAVLGSLAAPGSGAAAAAGAEPLLEGRVLLSSGPPVAGARVRLFVQGDLGRSLRATADESGYFAFPLKALRRAAPLPARLHLGQNYPNPFNPSTIIPYQVPVATRVRLEVFNILGQRVATLVDGERPAGFHTATWDATDASGRGVGSGVYLYRLLGGGERLTRSMVLLDGAVGSGGGGGSGGAATPARGEGQLYGLTVWGPGLVPYVDPAFRVGGEPVEIRVQPLSSLPRGKALAGGGLLGDVNRDGQVDLADALLVALYSEDPTLSLANGDITLGDINRDGQVDLADARLIEAYYADPSDPSLPEGIGAPVGAGTQALMLYWTDADGDRIQRSRLDGSGVEDVVDSGLVNPRGLAVDEAAGKIYWTDYGSDRIQRSNLDGSQVEDLVTEGLRIPLGLALDTAAGKLYWTDSGTGKIQRANLDGSQVEDLVTGLQTPLSLALDTAAGKLYWTDSGTGKIQRANLDGTQIEDLVTTGLDLSRGLAVDAAGGKLYWTDSGTDKIQRANLDGSQVEELVTEGLHTPRGLALDTDAGKLYWTDSGTGKIQRSNLDGTEVEDLVTEGLLSPRDLALARTVAAAGNRAPVLVPLADRTAAAGDTLTLAAMGSDPDGDALTYTASSSTEAVVSVEIADSLLTIYPLSAGRATITVTVRDPEGLEAVQRFAVLVVGAANLGAVSRLYWTDAEADRIRRSHLDGSGVEDVVDSGLVNPRGLAVDQAAGKLYWTDYGSDRIQRANLDGSEVEDLVTAGLQIPLALALDAAGGKLYWTDNGSDRIQRSNLDGTEVEDLVTGLQTPLGLALDAAAGKLYWSDSGADRIQRANLDGSQVEDLVTTGLQIPRGLALDTAAGKLYWADSGTDRIQRANLDGTEIEDLVTTGLGTPRGLAVDVAAGKLYWADSGTDRIQRSNLDGSEIEDLVTEGLLSPRGLALARIPSADNQPPELEPLADRTAATGDSLSFELAGSDPDDDALTYTASSGDEAVASVEVADSLVTLRLLAVGETAVTVTARDPGGLEATRTFTVTVQASNEPPLAVPWLYWSDARTDRIQRAELDGSDLRTLVGGLMQPRDLALDRDGGRMYWTDSGADKIQRAHLDGSKVEDLVTEGLKEPFGIALDLGGGKMYWSDWGTDRIQRSNLDGSEIEDLVATGLNEPYGLALDLGEGKIYWTDWGSDRIQRANLDGSEVEDLVTGLNQPRGIALDLEDGRMYWPDWGTDKIQRANLDGSEVEDLVTEGLRTSQAIALDLDEGRMYWTDYGTDKIQRAHLDGSQVEDLITSGLKEPYGLTLGAGLPAQILKVEGASATLNLAGRFRDPEGGALTLAAASSDEAVATATLADSVLTISPVTPGRVTVAVTARDEGGRQTTLPVAVTVYPANRPPVAKALADRKIRIGSPDRVELSDAFTDPDETDVLTYTAASSNEAVATAAVEGTGLRITPKSIGQTGISVTARDPKELEASLSFRVTVEPKPPPRPPRTPPGSGSDDGDGNGDDGGGPVTPPPPTPPPPPPTPPPTPPPPGQNNAPTFDERPSATRSVAENTEAGEDIGNPVTATDSDDDRLTYNLEGTDAGSFTLASTSGQLRTRSGATYDYETKPRYSVSVKAEDGHGGIAAIDVTIHVADVNEPPGRPSAPWVEPASSTSLTVTWTEPVNTGPGIEDYDVQYRKDGSFLPWPHDGPGTTTTITGLEVNNRYEVQVRATNDEGTGEWSSSGFRGICSEGGDAPTPVEVEVTAVPIVVASTTDEYFVLYVRHDVDGATVEAPVLVKRGEAGTTTLAENVAALPAERYRVEKYLVADPADVDGDCIDDLTDLDSVGMNPLNPAAAIALTEGALSIPDLETFETLSLYGFVKFIAVGIDTDQVGIYFANTETYEQHADFLDALDFEWYEAIDGSVTYDPDLVAPNGNPGVYYYYLEPSYSFSLAARFYTVFAAGMPLLEDNLAFYIKDSQLRYYQSDLPLFRDSRMSLVFDEDIRRETSFLALNPAEGYGLLRVMDPDERPHDRDVVIYEALPNELPRVAGIISTVPQTPLSHVNLRAVQDGIPNAYIRGALEDGYIKSLIGRHVRYTVTDGGWDLEAATPADVDAHYESSRPATTQTPQRDLEVTEITPLSEIGFDDWDAFGVKAANVAVLGTLGFPEGTVPDGFAIPFYFYDEFMKHNGFYTRIEAMLADEAFQTDFEAQADSLKKLRKAIEDAETPDWIVSAIETMNASFSEGINRRYRSSTNNEDLPGFNGAGLYDSKSQKPSEDEKDLAKSLKEVYAGLWNFRAFVERDFHRIDHLAAAMGVLVHPSYRDELANGVAVSFDPIYGRDGRYYVNTQVGEDLVTNPEAHSVPEEVLLNPSLFSRYTVLSTSNLVEPGTLLMSDDQLEQLGQHLQVIHNHFKGLYNPEAGEPFAMEIEFKITSEDILAIKQARPWVFGAQVDE